MYFLRYPSDKSLYIKTNCFLCLKDESSELTASITMLTNNTYAIYTITVSIGMWILFAESKVHIYLFDFLVLPIRFPSPSPLVNYFFSFWSPETAGHSGLHLVLKRFVPDTQERRITVCRILVFRLISTSTSSNARPRTSVFLTMDDCI